MTYYLRTVDLSDPATTGSGASGEVVDVGSEALIQLLVEADENREAIRAAADPYVD